MNCIYDFFQHVELKRYLLTDSHCFIGIDYNIKNILNNLEN